MEQKRGERRKNKDFKRGGKLGQGVGVLKKGGVLEPLYKLWITLGMFLHMVWGTWVQFSQIL